MIEYFNNLLELLRPKEYLESIYQVDFKTLKDRGILGLILDLDETLLPRELLAVSPALLTFIEHLKGMGFLIHILSNNTNNNRVEYVGKNLDITYSIASMKPLPFAFNAASKTMKIPSHKIAVIGDQLFMDILGGNLAKMYTILVKPMSEEKYWLRKLMRSLEDRALRRLDL